MANEFKHGSVGTQLTQAEWESTTGHVLNSQATGDIIYASSATQLSRLGIGSSGQVLKVTGGVPAWGTDTTNVAASALTGTTMAANVVASSLTSVGTLTSLTTSGAITAPSIEVRRDGNTPFIDFSNDTGSDYDARIQLTGDNALGFYGADYTFNGHVTATGNITTQGNYFYNYVADDAYGGYVLRNDTLDATHIYWEWSKRNTNEDVWLIAYNGSSWLNVVKWDYSAASMRIPEGRLILGEANTNDNATIEFDGNAVDFHIGLDDSADSLMLGTGTTLGSNSAIVVNSSRLVGIGTSTFTAAAGLAIKKNGDNLYLEQSNADNGWIVQTLDSTGYLYFERRGEGGSPSNTVYMTVTTGGHLGINTQTPIPKTHIFANATTGTVPYPLLALELADGGADTAAGEGPAINFYIADSTTDSTGAGTIYARKGAGLSHLAGQIATVRISPTDAVGSGDMTFSTAENAGALVEHVRIGSDGYVGIATVDPDYPLHIRVANEDLPMFKLEADMGTNNNRELTIKSPSTDSASEPFRINSSNALAFETDGTQRMLINSGGNLSVQLAATFASTVSATGYVYIYRGNTGYEGGQLSFGRAVDNSIGWSIDSFGNDANDSLRFLHASWSGTVAAQFVSSVDTFYVYHNMQLAGTTPTFIIGDGGAEDTRLIWDGNAVDYYMAIDDTTDYLHIGTGSSVGAAVGFTMNSTGFFGLTSATNASSYPQLRLTNKADDASAPYLDLWKHRAGGGGTPTDNDLLGVIRTVGYNSSAATWVGSSIVMYGSNVTNMSAAMYIQNRWDNVNQNHIALHSNKTYLYGSNTIVASTASNGIIVGHGDAADRGIVWDGNAVDYYASIEDADDSFRMGTGSTLGSNTFLVVGSTGIVYFTNANGMYVKDDVGMHWGTGADYRMRYEAANTRWVMWTNDTNGAGANEDLIRIDDGQKDIDANSNWVDNAFDAYDDALLLAASKSPTAEAYDFGNGILKRGVEALVEVGVLREYEDGWIGYNDQRMAALLAGGIYQTRQLVDNMEKKINDLENKLKALGG